MRILTKKAENLPKCFPLVQAVTDLVASRSIRDLFSEAIRASCEWDEKLQDASPYMKTLDEW